MSGGGEYNNEPLLLGETDHLEMHVCKTAAAQLASDYNLLDFYSLYFLSFQNSLHLKVKNRR